jgi:hypothetical protein
MVADEFGRENTTLLHTPTYSEHPDADTFRKRTSEYIGLPITIQEDGRDIWTLAEQYSAIPSNRMPFCTEQLKIRQMHKYLKRIEGNFTLYYGYGADEWQRVQKQTARFEVKGIKTAYPLVNAGLTGEDAKRIIRDEWKFCLPEPYLYLKHNNCLPCFKGGKGYFVEIVKSYPQYYERAAKLEETTGYTVFQDITLRQLQERAEAEQLQLSIDDYNTLPCMCAV